MDKSFLNSILEKSEELKSSDIHISSGHVPYVRINGSMKPMDGFEVLSARNVLDMMLSIMDKNSQENFIKRSQADFAYSNADKKRYRVNIFRDNNGIGVVFRALGNNLVDLENSDYPEVFRKIAMLDKGLVLVCGPTGSGKSTTLSSIIDYINKHTEKHIITIEDPIEHVYKSDKSLINQREVGRDVLSFSDGLRGALREDPDVILIGEMRDKETIKMALTAAETGHLVFSTLHTMSASKTIDRIIDSVDSGEKDVIRSMLSTSLQAVILQALLRRPEGKGRIAAFEILVGTGAIRNMIRENKVFQIDSMIQTGSKFGMTTMRDYVEKLIRNNLVDPDYAITKISGNNDDAFRTENQSKYYEVK